MTYEVPEFDGKNIPVKEVAKLMGKDQQFIEKVRTPVTLVMG